MPIIDLQRSVRQVGRIRIGEQAATSNGRSRPVKLDTFRLSSPQRGPIERAAQLYGGQVREMTNDRSDDRWEVVTQASSIPVVIPPTNHLSQWYELWSAAGCDRRCDGQEAIVLDGRPTNGAECVCNPENRQCQATTRLSVVLPELEALGVWRLDSKGYYAAIELAGSADLCAVATRHGYSIPARLDLEQRTRRTRDAQGKPQTFRFAVPVLSVDVSLPQAKAILGQADVATGEITTPSMRSLEERINGSPKALAALNEGLEASAQYDAQPAVAELPPPPPADIPTPRTADQYHADNGHDAADEPTLFAEPVNPPIALHDPDARPLDNRQRRRIMALQRALKMDTDQLRELTAKASGGRTDSLAADGGLYDTEAANLIETLDRMEVEARTKAEQQ